MADKDKGDDEDDQRSDELAQQETDRAEPGYGDEQDRRETADDERGEVVRDEPPRLAGCLEEDRRHELRRCYERDEQAQPSERKERDAGEKGREERTQGERGQEGCRRPGAKREEGQGAVECGARAPCVIEVEAHER